MELITSDLAGAAGGTRDAIEPRYVFGDDDAGGSGDGGRSDGNGGSSSDRGSDRSDSAGSAERKREYNRERQREYRQRKAGKRAPSAASQTSVPALTIESTAGLVFLLHWGIAEAIHKATKNEGLARTFFLSQNEAMILARPIAAIEQRYLGQVSGDAGLFFDLAKTMIGLYGAKFMGAQNVGAQTNGQPQQAAA